MDETELISISEECPQNETEIKTKELFEKPNPLEELERNLNFEHYGSASPGFTAEHLSVDGSYENLASCCCHYSHLTSEELEALPKQINPELVCISELNDDEIRLIENSWLYMRREKVTYATMWYLAFFRKYPQYQSLFHDFDKCPIEDLPANEYFINRMNLVMDSIDLFVALLRKPSKCNSEMFSVGIKHTGRANHTHFKYFQETTVSEIKRIMEHTIRDLDEVERVWNKFFSIMFGIMADATLINSRGDR